MSFCEFIFFLVLQKVVGNKSHINPIAEELSQRFIVDGYVIKDEIDIIFLSRIIEGFSRNIASNDKVTLACVLTMGRPFSPSFFISLDVHATCEWKYIAVSAQLTAETPYTLQWSTLSAKIALSHGGIWTPSNS